MDQLIFASLSHTHYWYEVGMLKVPAVILYYCEFEQQFFLSSRAVRQVESSYLLLRGVARCVHPDHPPPVRQLS